jgi:nudix-type nucleoside diphosphatase (YffH/AdpP family)
MENENVKILKDEVLSNNWYTLRKLTFRYRLRDGSWIEQIREAYDRGNGATILLYSKIRKTVILTRQFRLPTFINGNADGLLIEACAGLLDKENPEECIRRETEEEPDTRLPMSKKFLTSICHRGQLLKSFIFLSLNMTET